MLLKRIKRVIVARKTLLYIYLPEKLLSNKDFPNVTLIKLTIKYFSSYT